MGKSVVTIPENAPASFSILLVFATVLFERLSVVVSSTAYTYNSLISLSEPFVVAEAATSCVLSKIR